MATVGDKVARGLMKRLSDPINAAASIILANYTVAWGLWVANPFWKTFDQAQMFSFLLQAAPEWFWGMFAIVTGVMMMYGIVRNSYRSLTAGMFIGTIHWFIIGVCYFIGDWQNTGGLTALTIMTYCSFIYLNLRLNKALYTKNNKK